MRERELENENLRLKIKLGELVLENDHLKKLHDWAARNQSEDSVVINPTNLEPNDGAGTEHVYKPKINPKVKDAGPGSAMYRRIHFLVGCNRNSSGGVRRNTKRIRRVTPSGPLMWGRQVQVVRPSSSSGRMNRIKFQRVTGLNQGGYATADSLPGRDPEICTPVRWSAGRYPIRSTVGSVWTLYKFEIGLSIASHHSDQGANIGL